MFESGRSLTGKKNVRPSTFNENFFTKKWAKNGHILGGNEVGSRFRLSFNTIHSTTLRVDSKNSQQAAGRRLMEKPAGWPPSLWLCSSSDASEGGGGTKCNPLGKSAGVHTSSVTGVLPSKMSGTLPLWRRCLHSCSLGRTPTGVERDLVSPLDAPAAGAVGGGVACQDQLKNAGGSTTEINPVLVCGTRT